MNQELKATVKALVVDVLTQSGNPLIPNSLLDALINERLNQNWTYSKGGVEEDPSDVNKIQAFVDVVARDIRRFTLFIQVSVDTGATTNFNYMGLRFTYTKGETSIFDKIGIPIED